MKQIRLSGIVEDSIVDGPGLRLTIFVQGCVHRCPGCHNPQTHDINGGVLYHVDEIKQRLINNPLCSGLTLSGGEPLLQSEALSELAEFSQKNGKNVWLYSGYTWEEILEMFQKNAATARLLKACDVLVDGPYIESERDLKLFFRGSKNQRIIDVQKSLKYPEKSCVCLSFD